MWKKLIVLATSCHVLWSSPLASLTEFSQDFYDHVDETTFVASPFSVYAALSMAYMGAKGITEDEIAKTLRLQYDKENLSQDFLSYLATAQNGGCDLRIANSLWVKENFPILSSYQDIVETSFLASVQTLNFSDPVFAACRINQWISDSTEGKITDLLSPMNFTPATALVLANAIYFKGAFCLPFDAANTCEGDFAGGIAPMMEQTANFPYFETKEAQIAAFPFVVNNQGSPRIAFLVVLPKEGEPIPPFSDLPLWLDQLQRQRLHVQLPKFSIKTPLTLNPILQQMGMQQSFTEMADFSGIDGRKDLYISSALHQAFFSLDENGVTAAAATALVFNCTTALRPPPPPPIPFIVNRPFLFFIVDLDAKIPLFVGRLTRCN